jgi:hypothetical protein
VPSSPDAAAGGRARGLPIVVLALLVVAGIGVVESVSGLQAVVGTAGGVFAVLVPLTVVAVVLRVAAGWSGSPWPGRGLLVLAAASVVLAVLVVVTTYRAHTSADRFADRAAELPLPGGYRALSAGEAEAGDLQHAGEPQHAVRVWRVPSGADACADIRRAFRSWADGPSQSFSRGDRCAVVADDGTDKSEVSVSADGSKIVLEMWMEGSSLIHF